MMMMMMMVWVMMMMLAYTVLVHSDVVTLFP